MKMSLLTTVDKNNCCKTMSQLLNLNEETKSLKTQTVLKMFELYKDVYS